MKIQYKEFPGKVVNWDDATLTITHFISTETQDSGGDVMKASGMKVRGKPVVLFQHGQDPVFGNEPIAKPLKFEAGEFEGKTGILATTKYFDDRKLTIPHAWDSAFMKRPRTTPCRTGQSVSIQQRNIRYPVGVWSMNGNFTNTVRWPWA